MDNEKDLAFDLSDKNNKGLKIAQQTLDAIKDIIQSVPPGVQVAQVAIDVLNKHIGADGKQGVVTFQELKDAIDAAAASAQKVNPEFQNLTSKILAGAKDAFPNGALDPAAKDKLISGALTDFVTTLGQMVEQSVGEGLTNAFLRAQVNTGFLAGLNDKIATASDTYQASAHTPADLKAFGDAVTAAGLDAVDTIKALAPVLRIFAGVVLDVGHAFDDALSTMNDGAVGLATSIAKLDALQKSTIDAFDQRIYELQHRGQKDPAIIKRRLPELAQDFELTRLANFGSLSELVAARNGKDLNGTPFQLSQEEFSSFLKKQPGQAHAPTYDEKIAALDHLKELAETDLQTRIDAINAELDAKRAAHQETIDNLSKERADIQQNAQEAIQARQDELSVLQETIGKMQAWAGLRDSTQSTIEGIAAQGQSPIERFDQLTTKFDQAFADFGKVDAAHPGLSDSERIAAGEKVGALGTQLLDLAKQAGFAVSSEAYQLLQDKVTDALTKVSGEAGAQSEGLLDKQQRALDLQTEVKDLTKETNDKLKTIDASIKAEQDAMVAEQKAAQEKIDTVSANTAGVLQYIEDLYKATISGQRDELKAKLDKLGVHSVDLVDIAGESLATQREIRDILAQSGISVTDTGKSGETKTYSSAPTGSGAAALGAAGVPLAGPVRTRPSSGSSA